MQKITFKYPLTLNRGVSEPIVGYEFDLKGVRLIVHKKDARPFWYLSEYRTGLSIAMIRDRTRKAVMERAEQYFLKDRPDHFQKLIRQVNDQPRVNT